MPSNIVVPEMGESIVDARIAKWLKHEGDAVSVGEPLVELETDKVDVEVAAPQSGVLSSIVHKDGADVKIGDVLGIIESGRAERGAGAPASESARRGAGVSADSREDGKGQRAEGKGKDREEGKGKGEKEKEKENAKASAGAEVAATPAARRLARQENVDLSTVKPEGPRVTPDDIKSAKPAPKEAPAAPRTEARTEPTKPTSQPSTVPTPKPRTHVPTAAASERSEERVRMSRRRATIAKRLVEAQATAAMLTTFNEIDMTLVMQLRERRKQAFKDRYGVSLGLSSFFV